jgi:glucose-6-phosphate 1-epimerase
MEINDMVRTEKGQGGLTRLVVATAAAEAEIYLHGAHVTRYGRRGERTILWMSEKSLFQTDKAIRGGVPLVFPWFGPRGGGQPGPVHGFGRLMQWEVESTNTKGDDAEIVLALRDSVATRAQWPHAFKIRYTIRVGKSLDLSFAVTNSGNAAFEFEEALHTYFAVSDVRRISVTGLENTNYLDKVGGSTNRELGNKPVTFTGETDRVYQPTTGTCVIHDPTWNRQITIAKSSSNATVVWNPWAEKAKEMADLGDDEWAGMVCVETANALDSRIKLAPGQTHKMAATIR